MTNEPPSQEHEPHWTLISIALFAIGLLILVPSGLCVVALVPGLLLSIGMGDFTLLLTMSILAGPAIAIGVALVYAGLNSRRR